MKKPREKHIVHTVLNLIKDNNLTIPILIEDLITKLGIRYEVVEFDDNVSGALLIEKGSKLICVSLNEGEQRRRFSAAHELGHLFLHHDLNINLDKQETMYLRDSLSSEGSNDKEIEANFFAANLLMPEQEIKNRINLNISIDDNVLVLSRLFNVSQAAMAIRLNFLGYQ